MAPSAKPKSPHSSRRATLWLVVLVVLALAYIAVQPHLERLVGMPLPRLDRWVADSGEANEARWSDRAPAGTASNTNNAGHAGGKEPFPPDNVGRLIWTSPAGLAYGIGPNGEHRIDHVLNHLRDDPDRHVHSVFLGDKYAVFAWIDQAYRLAQSGDSRVKSDRWRGNRRELTIDMLRPIGYEGGVRGRQNGFPKLSQLRLILENDHWVVTAYPVAGDE